MDIGIDGEDVGAPVVVEGVQKKVDFIFHVKRVASHPMRADACRLGVKSHVDAI